MDDPKDLQTVLYGMSSPDPGVKCAAIHAFSRLKPPSDASHLCSLLDDDAWRVRTLAAETIVSMFKHDWVAIDRFIELSLLSANRTTLLQELRPEMPQ
jgi:HEAT repeat protein